MISKSDLERLYKWSQKTIFPFKKENITSKYMGYEILICYLKYGKKKTFYPHKQLTESIFDIVVSPEIFSLSYIKYPPRLKSKPHRDYNPYEKEFKRIQLPVRIPDNNTHKECYIEWIDSGERVYWREGEIEVFNVEELHHGENRSNQPMEFLYVDVNSETIIEL